MYNSVTVEVVNRSSYCICLMTCWQADADSAAF